MLEKCQNAQTADRFPPYCVAWRYKLSPLGILSVFKQPERPVEFMKKKNGGRGRAGAAMRALHPRTFAGNFADCAEEGAER